MNKFIMALAMAALIGSAVVAGLNNKKLGEEKDLITQLNRELARLNSDLDQTTQSLEAARVDLDNAEAQNQQVQADLSLAKNELQRQTREANRLQANYDDKKAQLAELDLLKEKLRGRTPESVTIEYEGLVQRKQRLTQDLASLQDEITQTVAAVESNEQRIDSLTDQEAERQNRIALNGMEADVVAINREYGFVIVNAGSEDGVRADSSLLVQRDVDRIGRLRIVSIEPQVTVADIVPGSLAPGVELMVRDKVIFENVR